MARSRAAGDFRDVDGVLILDKPGGTSSNRALQQVRRLYRARKAGHCGSLDPLATGVLPVCFGEATKYSGYLLGADKRYRAACLLGQTTTTGDAEGEVVETRPVGVDAARIERVLIDFVGEIEQVPPMHSAIKHEGRRLYELAREGKQVERKPRRVDIRSLELVSLEGSVLTFEVHCSKGTYVRTLAEDIGAALDCGAHLIGLRRIAVDPYDERQAYDFDHLEQMAKGGLEALDAALLPVGAALSQFEELRLDAGESHDIGQGKRVRLGQPRDTGLVRLIAFDGRFLGLGEVLPDGILAAKRLMNTAR